MEKAFIIARGNNNNVNFCPPDAAEIPMTSDKKVIIQKWGKNDKFDPKSWSWELILCDNGNKIAANLKVDNDYVFAGAGMYIGKGVLLILDTKCRNGQYEGSCFRYDISIAELMKKHGVTKLTRRCPKDASIHENNGMTVVHVFDLDGNELKDLNGIFTLNPEVPYLLQHTRLQGSRKKEWTSLYIPKGYKWQNSEKKAKPEYKHPDKAVELAEKVEEQKAAVGTPVLTDAQAEALKESAVIDVAPQEASIPETDTPITIG